MEKQNKNSLFWLVNTSFCQAGIWHCNLQYHRFTVIFKFFWGGTWGCEKIWKGVLYFRVLLHFYVTIFQSLSRGYMRCPLLPPLPPPCVHLCSVYLYNKRACPQTMFKILRLRRQHCQIKRITGLPKTWGRERERESWK